MEFFSMTNDQLIRLNRFALLHIKIAFGRVLGTSHQTHEKRRSRREQNGQPVERDHNPRDRLGWNGFAEHSDADHGQGDRTGHDKAVPEMA